MPLSKESGLLSAENIEEIANYYRFGSDNHAFNIMALIAHIDGLQAERDALREALEEALPWIGVREDNRGHWCPPEVRKSARVALERLP